MLQRGPQASRPIDRLRPGLLAAILHRLQAFNANTRRLLRLLEEPDWRDLGAQVFHQVRKRVAL